MALKCRHALSLFWVCMRQAKLKQQDNNTYFFSMLRAHDWVGLRFLPLRAE